MADSVANLLLQITGDEDDAKRALEEAAADLAVFGRETAEATADVDTDPARRALDEAKARLKEFAAEKTSATANVSIAKALVDIEALEARLAELDRKDVDIDVDVKRGVVEDIGALSSRILKLGDDADLVSKGGLSNIVGSLLESAKGAKVFGVGLGTAAEIGAALVPIIGAIVAALAALAASLTAAVGGLGVLAAGFTSTLIPAVILAIGAISRFKEQADIAGTAAHSLKEAAGEFFDIFKNATAGGADAVFRGLADALATIQPLVRSLGPAFTALGKSFAATFRTLAQALTSADIRLFFREMAQSAAELGPVFGRVFGSLARILANIGRASLPIFVAALKAVDGFLAGIARKTSDVSALQGVFRGLVAATAAWVDLLGGLTSLVGGFVQALAPIGNSMVRSLADGARALGDWFRSKEGMERTQKFFEDVGPLISQVAQLVAKLVVIFLQFTELVAPALEPIVKGLNQLASVIIWVLEQLNKIPASIRGMLGTIAELAIGFGKVKVAGEVVAGGIRLLIAVLGTLGGAFGAALGVLQSFASLFAKAGQEILGGVREGFNAARSGLVGTAREIAQAAVVAVRGLVDAGKGAGTAIFNAVRAGFSAVRGTVVDLARTIAKAAVDAVRGLVGGATNAGTAVINAVRGGFNSARSGAVSAARDIASSSVDAVRGLVGGATNAGTALINAVRSGISAARGGVVDAARAVGQAAVDGLNALKGAAESAGRALISAIGDGMRAAIGGLVSIAKKIWDAINNALPDISINIHIPTPSVPDIPNPADLLGKVVKTTPAFSTATTIKAGKTFQTGSTIKAKNRGDNNFYISAPAGSAPDVDSMLAQADVALRARGIPA